MKIQSEAKSREDKSGGMIQVFSGFLFLPMFETLIIWSALNKKMERVKKEGGKTKLHKWKTISGAMYCKFHFI